MNPDDLCVWPDGTYCNRSELSEMTHMSDDFVIIPYGDQDCGVCMEVVFTGASTNQHTCRNPTPALSVEYVK